MSVPPPQFQCVSEHKLRLRSIFSVQGVEEKGGKKTHIDQEARCLSGGGGDVDKFLSFLFCF